MPDEIKEEVEDTTVQTGAEETTEVKEEVDYDAELDSQIKKFENEEGYKKRKGIPLEEVEAQQIDIKGEVREAIKEIIPTLRESLSPNLVDTEIGKVSANPSEQALIKWHLEHSVGETGTLAERVENAKLIANKKTIQKTVKELTVANQNKSQFSGTGVGSHTEETFKVSDNTLSKEQINHFKSLGWDESKIARFKKNYLKTINKA